MMSRSNDIRMSVEDLEKILKHLPEPQYVHLGLVGFGKTGAYFEVFRQIGSREMLPGGMEVDIETEPEIKIKDPTKEKVLELYRRWHGKTDACSLDFIVPGIDLQCIGWYSEHPRVNMFLDFRGMRIEYDGEEPSYIAKMKQEAAQTGVAILTKKKGYDL